MSDAAIGVSPLVEIERAVQERLRATGSADDATVRALIEDEVARWSADVRRGDRSFDLMQPAAVVERAFRNLRALGPLQALLDDDDVWEIHVNAPDEIFVRRRQGPSGYHDETFHDDAHVELTLGRLTGSSDPRDETLADGSAVFVLPRGHTLGDHVVATIRRPPDRSPTTRLVADGILSAEADWFLRASVRSGATILVTGSPGAGRSTLLGSLAAAVDPRLRVVASGTARGIDVPIPNAVLLAGPHPRPSLDDLVTHLVPETIVVDDLGDEDVLPFVRAAATGVPGLATRRARSARLALDTLTAAGLLSEPAASPQAVAVALATGLDLVVHCSRTPSGRCVSDVLAIEGTVAGSDGSASIEAVEMFRRTADGLRWTGYVPRRLSPMLEAAHYDLGAVLGNGPPSGPDDRHAADAASASAQAERRARLRARLLATGAFDYPSLAAGRGQTTPAVRKWVQRQRDRHALFTVRERGEALVPAFLLDEDLAPRPEYVGAIEALVRAGSDGWGLWAWFTSPTGWLDGQVPAEHARVDAEAVTRAAERRASNAA